MAVRDGARARAEAMCRYASSPPAGCISAIEAAGTFHDLGKLDPDNQAALAQSRSAKLCWDHIDAGVAHLLACGSGMAAWLVRAHHAPGLPSNPAQTTGKGRPLRGRRNDADASAQDIEQIARTDATLADLLAAHAAVAGAATPARSRVIHGLEMRLALSCLVDADHTDTAQFDSGYVHSKPPEPRWAERLTRLDAYVTALHPSGNAERDSHRKAFYATCRDSAVSGPMVACEGPVGIGKTTAVTAYLLRRAENDGLRRVVIVAPYTNIISQIVETLRQALTLPGEAPEEVVAEHHHRADFSTRDARNLAITWSAPVIVTTAVQFFETLAANTPAALRKLHALPGSAVFIDEAHAALPAHLWPQNWLWLRALSRRWSCRFIFASGSLARFWENENIVTEPQELPELLGGALRDVVLSAERRRIRYEQADRFETVAALVAAIRARPGPRLVILNTVQSAAVVARTMREAKCDVLHLSTALAPKDRTPLLGLIKQKLARGPTDWTLVATSCVESGVDLSFQTAFRERFSAASLIQTGGRVNRHGGGEIGAVIDFLLDTGGGITAHPAALYPADVLRCLLGRGAFDADQYDPAEIVTKAMTAEIKDRGGLGKNVLCEKESAKNYPCVARLGRVIDADTRLVVIDPDLAKRIESHERISFRDLLAGSVQLWATKIDALQLRPLRGGMEAYQWPYGYDPAFLGIMDGILKINQLHNQGFILV